MESNNWTHIYTGSDFQVELLKIELSQAEVLVLTKKPTLEVAYGGSSTTSLTRLFVPTEQLEIANPIAKHFDELQNAK